MTDPLSPGMITARKLAMALAACTAAEACADDPWDGRAPVEQTAIDPCKLRLAHADEFDDLSIAVDELDGVRWTAHTPWEGDFGEATFSDPGPDGRPFAIVDGKLRITAFKEEDGDWRSGLIAAADESGAGWGLRYGYFEARMRLPPGPGTWPAFWLISLQPVSTRAPRVEIDVIEYYGHATGEYQASSHVWYKRPHNNRSRHNGQDIAVAPGSLTSGFHTYGVKVEPGWMTFYLDRKPQWQMPTPPELKTPLYPLVNLALGAGYPIDETPDPSVLEVDYVRIHALEPAPGGNSCPD